MDEVPLEEAARRTGRSPREVRLLLERGELDGKQRLGRWVVSRQGLHHLPEVPEPEEPADPRIERLEGEVRELRERLDEALERIEALEAQAPHESNMREALTPLFRGHH